MIDSVLLFYTLVIGATSIAEIGSDLGVKLRWNGAIKFDSLQRRSPYLHEVRRENRVAGHASLAVCF